MAHHHHHLPPSESGRKALAWAFVLNGLFFVIELIGGIYTNSIAIISDAIHDLGDTLSIGIAWLLERISGKKRDNTFSYGYRRFSTLSSVLICGILIAGSIVIIIEAVPRLWNPAEVDASGMIMLAVIGVLINGGVALKHLKKGGNLNQRAVMLHLLEDALGWLAVLIGAIVIHYTGWFIIDPILSLLIALFIAYNAIRNARNGMLIFLQGKPSGHSIEEVEDQLKKLEGVKGVHDLHLWSLDGERHIVTLHVSVGNAAKFDEVNETRKRVRSKLKELGLTHATIEIEKEHDPCELDDC